ncbi:hypothetical protein Rumeso_03395 [Rubellimicrobium mesophilum DSM 19309]|uniref:Oligosaccharide repeat unit polymerase n=1 Tax=Rubellimicrobium mesophilum DSM 19309 TaxID=442562 RepID=A0A017HKS8_9RHOB|nr:O-antigen polysaccharide polymerase Wzy [Rubellimicrobium mesophilum]EYD75067.1 hypothetical protein Rumeso_03395 [Rubellimicrobium mesophilum DSM 19309]
MKVSIYLILETILLVCLVVWFYLAKPGADPLTIWICLAIFYAYFLLAFVSPTTVVDGRPSYLSFRLGFLTFSYLLYFSPYQEYVLGLDRLGFSFYVRDTFRENSNLAVIAATIGVVAFCSGVRSARRRASAPAGGEGWRISPTLSWVAVPFLMMLLGLYFAMGWRSSGEGSYTQTASGGIVADGAVVMILMLCMLIVARAVILLAARRRLDPFTALGLVLSLWWALRLLSFGDRNSFILILMAGAVAASTYLLRMSRLVLVGGFVALLVLYNAVEIYRQQALQPGASLSDAFAMSQAEDSDRESSFNITTIALRATFDLAPAEHNYALGLYKLVGVLGAVPFVRGIIFGDSLEYDTTAAALTDFVLPPDAGWSVGTGIISDFYLDFGILGVGLGLFLVGWIGGAVERYARRNPRAETPALIYCLSVALFAELPRYAADFPVRIVAWALLLAWFAKLVDASRRKAHGRLQLRRGDA